MAEEDVPAMDQKEIDEIQRKKHEQEEADRRAREAEEENEEDDEDSDSDEDEEGDDHPGSDDDNWMQSQWQKKLLEEVVWFKMTLKKLGEKTGSLSTFSLMMIRT